MRPHQDYNQRIYEARDYTTLRDLLVEVTERAEHDKDFFPRSTRMAILMALRDVTSDDSEHAKQVIIDFLCPLCFESVIGNEQESTSKKPADGVAKYSPSVSQEQIWEAREARELLANWLAYWTEAGEIQIRSEACEIICGVAQTSNDIEQIKSACWALGNVGWRGTKVENTLWQLIGRDDITSDIAGGVLVDLGITPTHRTEFIRKLRERLYARPIRYNIYTLAKLGEIELIDDVLWAFFAETSLAWYTGKVQAVNEASESPLELDLKLTYLSQFSDENWFEESVQDRIWRTIFDVCAPTNEGRRSLIFTGNLVPRCDSKSTVPDFLSIADRTFSDVELDVQEEDVISKSKLETNSLTFESEGDSKGDPTHYFLEIMALRLKSAIRPRHISAWEHISREDLVYFLRLATINSLHRGSYSTSQIRAKESAWEMVAMAGGCWTSEEIQKAIFDESSGFAQGKVAGIVSCFPLEELPPIVTEELTRVGDTTTGVRDLSKEEDTSYFFAFRGMENIARATANFKAFRALLCCNSIYGDVLNSTCEALGEVAVYLTRRGSPADNAKVIEELWEAASMSSPAHRRAIATSGLFGLSNQDLLPASEFERLLDASEDESLNEFCRSLMIQAVGFLSDSTVVIQKSSERLKEIWLQNHQGDGLLTMRAHEALARHKTWEGENTDLYFDDMGLEEREGQLHLKKGAKVKAGMMPSLYFLYKEQPELFEPAVCNIIGGEENEGAYPLTFSLVRKELGESVVLRPAIVKTMVNRLRQPSQTVLRYLFDALAIGASQELLDESWDEVCSHWSGGARISLADAMTRAGENGAVYSNNALRTLGLLIRDQSFSVRRAAIRAASNYASAWLISWCEEWIKSEKISERRIAAEAIFWLVGQKAHELQDKALCDVESSVREAAKLSRQSNRDRRWADRYLKNIEEKISQESVSSERVASHFYAAGVALQSLGDDSHIRRLNLLPISDLHPHWRVWQQQTLENMKKNWQEKTRDWSERSEGVISWKGDATLIHEGQSLEITAWLWFQLGIAGHSFSSWGGNLQLKYPQHGNGLDEGKITIVLSDGRKGDIILRNLDLVNPEWIDFIGQGSIQ